MNVKCPNCNKNLHALAFQLKTGGTKHHIATNFLICPDCGRIYEATSTGVKVLR